MRTAVITKNGIIYERKQIASLRLKLIREVGNKCQGCGEEFPTEALQIDHLYPVCRGGSDSEDNYQVLCYSCNIKKLKLDKILPQQPIQTKLDIAGAIPYILHIHKCLRCPHEWASKNPKPIRCPKCKSPYWNIPKKNKEEAR